MMEGEFEKAENRLESAKNKQKMLADEAEKLNDSLKVYEQMEEKLGDRENEMDAELFSLKSQLRDSEYQREEVGKDLRRSSEKTGRSPGPEGEHPKRIGPAHRRVRRFVNQVTVNIPENQEVNIPEIRFRPENQVVIIPYFFRLFLTTR